MFLFKLFIITFFGILSILFGIMTGTGLVGIDDITQQLYNFGGSPFSADFKALKSNKQKSRRIVLFILFLDVASVAVVATLSAFLLR